MTETPSEGQTGRPAGHEQPNAGTSPSDASASQAPPGSYGPPPGYRASAQAGYGHPPGYGSPPGHGYPAPGYGGGQGGSDERVWGMFSHLGILLGGFFLGPLAFLVPLVIYLTKRDQSPFVRHHGAQALNIGLTVLIVTTVATILGFVLGVITFGIGPLIVLPVMLVMLAYVVAAAVVMILASMAANRGEWYRYPSVLAFPMIK